MDDHRLQQVVAASSERTVDGVPVTGEVWRTNLGSDELLLLFALRRGVFLERQWVEYLTRTRGVAAPLVEEALETLGRHVGSAQWFGTMSPRRPARGGACLVDVYYATGHALAALKRLVPSLVPFAR